MRQGAPDDARGMKESPGRAGARGDETSRGRTLDAPILSQGTNHARRGSRYASESCKVRVQKITVAFNHWVGPTRSLGGWLLAMCTWLCIGAACAGVFVGALLVLLMARPAHGP